MTENNATKLTRQQVWRALSAIIFDEQNSPVSVRMHPADIDVDIQMSDDQQAEVDRVLGMLGMPTGFLHDHRWSEGKPDESGAYGQYFSHKSPRSPLLPGWQVAVWCHVHTRVAEEPEPECDHQAGCPLHGDVYDCDPMPAEDFAIHAGPYDVPAVTA